MEKLRKRKNLILVTAAIFALLILIAYFYTRPNAGQSRQTDLLRDENGKILVSATLFPIYDFAKQVGGDKISVSFILPPGIESHTFSPTPREYNMISSSSLIFYSSALAEPWVGREIDEDRGQKFLPLAEDLADEKEDPHVWLDFSKDISIIDRIAQAYKEIDANNSSYYQERADAYKQKILDLDKEYSETLRSCRFKDLVHGGHQSFSYLARRYGLDYFPSQGPFPKMELDSERARLQIERLKKSGQAYIYYEELIMPSLADFVRQQTGVKMVLLNAAHNVGRYDIERGVDFIQIMEHNLQILKTGLVCE